MKLYDLTHTINSQTPVYPGDPAVVVEQAGEISKDGFCDHKLSFGTHVGTHFDAPAHMIQGGKQLKNYDIERFVVSATCIDASDGFTTDAINKQTIESGFAVLFYTGASDRYQEESYWHDYSVMTPEICKLLASKGVSLIGVDTGSVDNVDDFPVHKALLDSDILIIENLTNLKDLVGKTFELIALPLKLDDDGAPVRVIART